MTSRKTPTRVERGGGAQPDRDEGGAAGGNAGSKGQNVRRQDETAEPSGKQSRDLGDERGPHGGSGGGRGNRQNRAINRG
jgi:hypothetical protein